MKKVCHLTSAHKRYDQRILYRECVSLQENGYSVSLLVNDKIKDEIIKGVTIKSTNCGYTGKRFQRMIFGVKNIYALAKNENADIYHLHDPELLPLAMPLKRAGKKVIFDSHESYFDLIQCKDYLPKILRKTIAYLYRFYETWVVKRIDAVVVPAKVSGKNIFKGRAKKVIFINNVPRLDEIPKKERIQKKNGGACYVGKLTYDRGISILMRAAYKAGIPLYLAGTFSSESFQRELMGRKESKIIRYKGVLGREEVYELYGQCAMGVSTLLNVGQYGKAENLPTKVYEYMSMGLPVILSDFPYSRKMVKKYQFGLLTNPEDEEDIATKIKYLIDNPREAARLGKNGEKLILEKLNWSKEEKKLLRLYEMI